MGFITFKRGGKWNEKVACQDRKFVVRMCSNNITACCRGVQDKILSAEGTRWVKRVRSEKIRIKGMVFMRRKLQ